MSYFKNQDVNTKMNHMLEDFKAAIIKMLQQTIKNFLNKIIKNLSTEIEVIKKMYQ